LRPVDPRFPAIDSVCVAGEGIFLFQLTVGKTHQSKGKMEATKVLNAFVRAFGDAVQLIFVSPQPMSSPQASVEGLQEFWMHLDMPLSKRSHEGESAIDVRLPNAKKVRH